MAITSILVLAKMHSPVLASKKRLSSPLSGMRKHNQHDLNLTINTIRIYYRYAHQALLTMLKI